MFSKKIRETLEAEPDTLIRKALEAPAEIFEQKSYTIDLSTARDYTQIKHFKKTRSLTVSEITGTASIKLNSLSEPAHDLTKLQAFAGEIKHIFLCNTAQAGKTLVLKAGGIVFTKSVRDLEIDIENMQGDMADVKTGIQSIDGKVALESTLGTLATQTTLNDALSKLNSLDGKIALESSLSSLESKVATAIKQDLQATAAKQDTAKGFLENIYSELGYAVQIIEGDTIVHSNDEVGYTEQHSWVKIKETLIGVSGKGRIYFHMNLAGGGTMAHGCIRVNGVEVGTPRETDGGDGWNEDIDLEVGDKLQIYGYVTGTGEPETQITNFRIKGTIVRSIGVNIL